MNTWEDNFRLILHNDSTILMLSIKHGFAVLHRKSTLGGGGGGGGGNGKDCRIP